MENKFKKLPFVILFLLVVLLVYKLAGEGFTIGFLSVVLIGVVLSKREGLDKFIKGVVQLG